MAILVSGCSGVAPAPQKSPTTAGAPAPASDALSISPVNPDFTQYQKDLKAGDVAYKTKEGYYLGYAPSPLDLSYLDGMQIQRAAAYHGVGSFDLRTRNKLTPVKNQGQAPNSWAFAALGSLESTLKPGETLDFSENNMKNTHGFFIAPNSGGNEFMAMAYLTRWGGPVKESSDPYNASSTWPATNLTVQKHVQDVLIIPGRANASDNDNIKWAVMNYGALFTTLCYNDSAYDNLTHSYYFNESRIGQYSNLAVDIVGWDDAYTKNNFSSPAPGDGAFIVRNSWGNLWGDNGYFYVSYYDTGIGKRNALFAGDPNTNYDRVYQYDPMGWTNTVGYINSQDAWCANLFRVGANQKIEGVGFYTTAPNTEYTIYVYKLWWYGIPPINNPAYPYAQATMSGVIDTPGYHTISLTTPISVTTGQTLTVMIKLHTPGGYPIAIEDPNGYGSGLVSNATSWANQSFVSNDGVHWSDITKTQNIYGVIRWPNANVCIKAYASGNLTTGSSYVSNTIPSEVTPGQKVNVSIAMKNIGTLPWSNVDGISLGAVGGDMGDAARFAPAMINITNGTVVNGSSSYTWNFTMTAPTSTGNYVLKYRMVAGDGTFFGDTVTKSVTVQPEIHDAKVILRSIPLTITAGFDWFIIITMKNTGNVPWHNGSVRLGAVDGASGDAAKFGAISLPIGAGVTVNPGEQYTWNFSIKAPSNAGNYTLKYRMVNGSEWFGDTISSEVKVLPVLLNAAVISNTIPSSMIKGNTYTVSVTMKNMGKMTWIGDFALGAIEDSNNSAAKFGNTRINLPSGVIVEQGQQYTWSFTMKAPDHTGTYHVKYRIVQGWNWFGDTIDMTVTVKTASASTASASYY